MHMTARRIRDGQALKEAMAVKGLTLTRLAARTRELDPGDARLGRPAGTGVSFQLIGFLTAPASRGVTGGRGTRARRYRETTSTETADLLELACDARPGQSVHPRGSTRPRRPGPRGRRGAGGPVPGPRVNCQTPPVR